MPQFNELQGESFMAWGHTISRGSCQKDKCCHPWRLALFSLTTFDLSKGYSSDFSWLTKRKGFWGLIKVLVTIWLDFFFSNPLPEAVGHLQSFIYLPYLFLYFILKFCEEKLECGLKIASPFPPGTQNCFKGWKTLSNQALNLSLSSPEG